MVLIFNSKLSLITQVFITVYCTNLENTSELLVPPKPKLLLTATLTSFSCASRGTKLKAVPTSGFSKFSVGGKIP